MKKVILYVKNNNCDMIVTGDYTHITWKVYEDYTVKMKIYYSDGYLDYYQDKFAEIKIPPIVIKYKLDYQVIMEIERLIEKVKNMTLEESVVYDGDDWEFYYYKNGEKVWEWPRAYIDGIEVLEKITLLINNGSINYVPYIHIPRENEYD